MPNCVRCRKKVVHGDFLMRGSQLSGSDVYCFECDQKIQHTHPVGGLKPVVFDPRAPSEIPEKTKNLKG